MNNTNKTILSFIGGFISGAIIIWGVTAYNNNRPVVDAEPMENAPTEMAATETIEITQENVEAVVESAAITVHDQDHGGVATVAGATLEKNGWVVIHEEKNGLIANALGAVRKDAGAYTNITIPLLRETEVGSRYWVVLYSDNADRLFNLKNDFPLKDVQGNVITKSFIAN